MKMARFTKTSETPVSESLSEYSAKLYEWSDTNLEGDITRNDCDKLIEWFTKHYKIN